MAVAVSVLAAAAVAPVSREEDEVAAALDLQPAIAGRRRRWGRAAGRQGAFARAKRAPAVVVCEEDLATPPRTPPAAAGGQREM